MADILKGQGIVNGPTTPTFDTPVPFVEGLSITVRHVCKLDLVRVGKPILDVLEQLAFIILDPQDVVGFFITDRLRNFSLRPHRIHRHNAFCHVQLP